MRVLFLDVALFFLAGWLVRSALELSFIRII